MKQVKFYLNIYEKSSDVLLQILYTEGRDKDCTAKIYQYTVLIPNYFEKLF